MTVGTLNGLEAMFDIFPRKKKRILHILHHMCTTHRECYISQSTIAKLAKCTRKHVNRTLKELDLFGFLKKMNRGVRKTCLYFMSWEMKKSRIFSMKKQEVTREVTQTYSSQKNISYSSYREVRNEDDLSKLPDYLEGLKKLSEDQRWKLSVFHKEVYLQALKECKREEEKGKVITKPYSYLFIACKKLSELRKLPPTWRKYYAWKEKVDETKEA